MQLWGVPTRLLAVFMLLSSMALIATGAAAQTPAPAHAKAPAATTGIPPAKVSKTWTGDFYFVDRAGQRGLSYEVTQLLEADLNKKLKTGNIKVHVVCIPVTRGEMIPALLEGRGDIATGNPTITPSA
jgi:ABC-type amino acid transport substrate-binding protein